MSDNSVTVVSLVVVDGPVRRANDLRNWLISSGVALPNARREPLWRPSALMPGPDWRTVVDDADEYFDQSANNGIDVIAERQVYLPGENLEPPTCPACAAPLDLQRYLAFGERWLDGEEPTVACATCGHARLLGDWPAPWGLAVGAPAVRFNNWPPLAETFLAELRERLSSRTFVVQAHW